MAILDFKFLPITLSFGLALLLSGCAISQEDQVKIDSVTTALPNEVAQCSFIADVSTSAFNIESARNDLKIQVAELGGNHLVETSLNHVVYPTSWGFRRDPFFYEVETTFYLSGRAYYCTPNTGVKKAQSPFLPVPTPNLEQIIPQRPYIEAKKPSK